MAKNVTYTCDECGETITSHSRIKLVAQIAKHTKIEQEHKVRDLCLDCADELGYYEKTSVKRMYE